MRFVFGRCELKKKNRGMADTHFFLLKFFLLPKWTITSLCKLEELVDGPLSNEIHGPNGICFLK